MKGVIYSDDNNPFGLKKGFDARETRAGTNRKPNPTLELSYNLPIYFFFRTFAVL